MNLVYDTIFREQHDFEFGRMVWLGSAHQHIIFHSIFLSPRRSNISAVTAAAASASLTTTIQGPISINAVYRNRCLLVHIFLVQRVKRESWSSFHIYNDEDGSFHEISAIKYDCCLAFFYIQYTTKYIRNVFIVRFFFSLSFSILFLSSSATATIDRIYLLCFFLDN